MISDLTCTKDTKDCICYENESIKLSFDYMGNGWYIIFTKRTPVIIFTFSLISRFSNLNKFFDDINNAELSNVILQEGDKSPDASKKFLIYTYSDRTLGSFLSGNVSVGNPKFDISFAKDNTSNRENILFNTKTHILGSEVPEDIDGTGFLESLVTSHNGAFGKMIAEILASVEEDTIRKLER